MKRSLTPVLSQDLCLHLQPPVMNDHNTVLVPRTDTKEPQPPTTRDVPRTSLLAFSNGDIPGTHMGHLISAVSYSKPNSCVPENGD
jgi:hypothetical protein